MESDSIYYNDGYNYYQFADDFNKENETLTSPDAIEKVVALHQYAAAHSLGDQEYTALAQESGNNPKKYVANRIKTMNESIYYNIDTIHAAISRDRQISFRYFEWAVDFTTPENFCRRARHNGALYRISPWALIWDDENYYMLGYDSAAGFTQHCSGCLHRQDRYQGRERPAGPDRCPDRRCIRHVLHLRGCHGCHLQCGPDQRSGQVHR